MNGAIDFWNGAAAAWWQWTVTATWQGALLLSLVTILLFAAKSLRPGLRYGLFLVVLLKLAVPPVVGMSYGFSDLIAMATEPPAQEFSEDGNMTITVGPATMEAGLVWNTEVSGGARLTDIQGSSWLLLLQGLGALAVLAHIGGQLHRARKARRNYAQADDSIRERLAAVCARMGLRYRPMLYVSEDVRAPQTGGVLRPFIVLPSWANALSGEELDILLAHEAAHVKRRDASVNGFQALLQAALWWNPLVWWLNRRIREEREYCCDDLVLARGIATGKTYSRTLVTVAERVSAPTSQWVAVGMADAYHVVDRRVRRALDGKQKGTDWTRYVSMPALVLLALWALPGNSREAVSVETASVEPVGAAHTPETDVEVEVVEEVNGDNTSTPPLRNVKFAAARHTPDGNGMAYEDAEVELDTSGPANDRIHLSANLIHVRKDGEGNSVVTYEGDVKAQWGDFQIRAERMQSNGDGMLLFEDAIVDGPAMEGLKAEELRINTKTRAFEINQGKVESIQMNGDTVERAGTAGSGRGRRTTIAVQEEEEGTTIRTSESDGEEEVVSLVLIPADGVEEVPETQDEKLGLTHEKAGFSGLVLPEDVAETSEEAEAWEPRVYLGANGEVQYYEKALPSEVEDMAAGDSLQTSETYAITEPRLQVAQLVRESEERQAEAEGVVIKVRAKILEIPDDADLGLSEGTHMYLSEGVPDEELKLLDNKGHLVHQPFRAGVASKGAWEAAEEAVRKLVAEDRARYVGSPSLTVRAGEEATIQIGEEIPYEDAGHVAREFVGLTLKVFATVEEKDSAITLQFDHSRTTKKEEIDGKPVFSTRALKGTQRFKQGQWAYYLSLLPGERDEIIALTAEVVE